MNKAFDEHFMRMALREAEKAADDGEVPTGCVIVDVTGLEPDAAPTAARILARAHNMPEQLQDATAHAEMLALTARSHVRTIDHMLSPYEQAYAILFLASDEASGINGQDLVVDYGGRL